MNTYIMIKFRNKFKKRLNKKSFLKKEFVFFAHFCFFKELESNQITQMGAPFIQEEYDAYWFIINSIKKNKLCFYNITIIKKAMRFHYGHKFGSNEFFDCFVAIRNQEFFGLVNWLLYVNIKKCGKAKKFKKFFKNIKLLQKASPNTDVNLYLREIFQFFPGDWPPIENFD